MGAPRIPSRAGSTLATSATTPQAATTVSTLGQGSRTGYLLKDRVGDVATFIRALQDVAAGGTVVDAEVVRQLIAKATIRWDG